MCRPTWRNTSFNASHLVRPAQLHHCYCLSRDWPLISQDVHSPTPHLSFGTVCLQKSCCAIRNIVLKDILRHSCLIAVTRPSDRYYTSASVAVCRHTWRFIIIIITVTSYLTLNNNSRSRHYLTLNVSETARYACRRCGMEWNTIIRTRTCFIFLMTLSDFEWFSEIFNNTKHLAACLRLLSFLSKMHIEPLSLHCYVIIHAKTDPDFTVAAGVRIGMS